MPALMPARLGADFTKLWAAAAVSTVGDGVTMVAGPLLAATLTRDPALVAGAAFAQALPSLLFSLAGGAYVDRVDRQRLILVIDLLRGAVLAGLAVLVATGVLSIPLLYAVFFLLGTGETVADTASVARLPAIVAPGDLASANARLMATFTVGNQFVAKPVGAGLFALAAALPFGLDAASFVVAATLIASMRPVPAERPARTGIGEGVRWLWSHRFLRTLALSMAVANLAFCGAFAVFVVYARVRLGVSAVGYGLLLTTFGVGGLAGTGAARGLRDRFGATALLRAGLVVETTTHLMLAWTREVWLAAAVLVVFGVHTMVWGVIATTVRQRATPGHLLGRVGGAYALLDSCGTLAGMLLGGLLAHALGITAPFWAAGAVTALVTAVAWRPLSGGDTPRG